MEARPHECVKMGLKDTTLSSTATPLSFEALGASLRREIILTMRFWKLCVEGVGRTVGTQAMLFQPHCPFPRAALYSEDRLRIHLDRDCCPDRRQSLFTCKLARQIRCNQVGDHSPAKDELQGFSALGAARCRGANDASEWPHCTARRLVSRNIGHHGQRLFEGFDRRPHAFVFVFHNELITY
jgi:hypothetical protein